MKRHGQVQRSEATVGVGRLLALGIWLIIHCVLILLGVIGYKWSRLLNWITSCRIGET
jgi:hypothetical protein